MASYRSIAFRAGLSAVVASLPTATALFPSQADASTPEPVITWRDCETDFVGPGAALLGQRLQCGVFAAPLDHLNRDGRTINVGVVRVRAMDAARREGALFFNNGGPGGNPARLLRSIAAGWSNTAAGDPRDGAKRSLADRYDLIAVIPRGLAGGWKYECLTGLPPRFSFLPTDLGEANWQRVIEEAQSRAAACTALPQAGYINTEQHVHDMDMVRRALGDATIQFYGISYGGKIGAWYAAMYPTHTGRMLLDSTMSFTRDFHTAHEASLVVKQGAFVDDVLGPVKKDPAAYGLGSDPVAVSDAVDTLPASARAAWYPVLDEPVRLAAALRLADWIRADGLATRQAFGQRIGRTRFAPDATMHADISWAATNLALLYTTPRPTTPQFAMGRDGDSVRQAVACNDSTWYLTKAQVLAMAVRNAAAYLQYDGDDIVDQLVCMHWTVTGARQPDLDPMRRVPPFLLLQSENDANTPMSGSREILARFDNARMLVAKGVAKHGLFNFTTSTCVESKAARFLLTGEIEVDASRMVTCDGDFDNPLAELPSPPAPPAPPAPAPEPPVPVPPNTHDEI